MLLTEFLTKSLEESGLTKYRLAKITKILEPDIGRYLSGSRHPKFKSVVIMLRGMGVSDEKTLKFIKQYKNY